MPRSPSLARDAALARMRRINRWLLAGAVAATGLLTDVAAQAFPGHRIKRLTAPQPAARSTVATATDTTARHVRHHHHAEHHALTPPAQAPQATPTPTPQPAPVVSGGS